MRSQKPAGLPDLFHDVSPPYEGLPACEQRLGTSDQRCSDRVGLLLHFLCGEHIMPAESFQKLVMLTAEKLTF